MLLGDWESVSEPVRVSGCNIEGVGFGITCHPGTGSEKEYHATKEKECPGRFVKKVEIVLYIT
jgi:hypothetical protein